MALHHLEENICFIRVSSLGPSDPDASSLPTVPQSSDMSSRVGSDIVSGSYVLWFDSQIKQMIFRLKGRNTFENAKNIHLKRLNFKKCSLKLMNSWH